MNLRSTGVERLQAFERGDLCTQGESTGVGFSPENFRKIKAELRSAQGDHKNVGNITERHATTLRRARLDDHGPEEFA